MHGHMGTPELAYMTKYLMQGNCTNNGDNNMNSQKTNDCVGVTLIDKDVFPCPV